MMSLLGQQQVSQIPGRRLHPPPPQTAAVASSPSTLQNVDSPIALIAMPIALGQQVLVLLHVHDARLGKMVQVHTWLAD